MAASQQNPNMATQKSDSGLHVALHPLVLLTISDYITRHTLRQQEGAIVGALMGQQNGREVTVEHAWEVKIWGGDAPMVDIEWFEHRLQQMKDVHKAPALDLVGWYSIVPTSGPELEHVTLHRQLSKLHPEATILLGFHPTAILEGSVGGKLPVTIYEANLEPLQTGGREDVEMANDSSPSDDVTFKELPYSVETGEAEMIGIDFVARGGGNATAVETVITKSTAGPKAIPSKAAANDKGKMRQEVEEENTDKADTKTVLTREEEELVASLTAKANAIKMLHSRINLITTYLSKLPPSYIAGNLSSPIQSTSKDHDYAPINQPLLRSIRALLNRLALLVPSDNAAFSQELLAEQNDVNLVSLLNAVTDSIKSAREMGRKFYIVDAARRDRKKGNEGWTGEWGDEHLGRGVGRNIGGGISGAGDLML